MPSRSNPNTPTSLKPKSARTLKSKRLQTQRLAAEHKISKPAPRTSQAIRRAAPLSKKKAKKLEKKIGYARKRAVEEVGEVEMKDVAPFERKGGRVDEGGGGGGKGDGDGDGDMEVDGAE